ncbi:MAG: cytochrome c3 family protein [Acidobacteriota bacterium]|nr:cytochrome c3 family protein [Acidobacteriota bacterium]
MKTILFLLIPAVSWAYAQEAAVDSVEASAECLDCHEEVYEDVLKYTPHRHSKKVACVDCHVNPAEHLEDADVGNISLAVGKEGMAACLKCHESDIHEIRPKKNQHASADVFCEDCHAMHRDPNPPEPLLASVQKKLCTDCHTDIANLLRKPFNHNLGHGTMQCSSCHNPHGGKGNKRYLDHRGEEATCVSCHTEKKGPFVFEHVTGVTGSCGSCHEAHGSSNPKQLTRAHVSQLCLECHSTSPSGLLGSQPSSSHNLRSPRFRECTTCHTAIHGSSRSPLLLK